MLAYCFICQISEGVYLLMVHSVYSTPCNKQCQSCPFFELTKTLTAEARLSTGKSGMARLADSWEQRAVATERSCEILREGKGLSDQLASSSTTALRLSGTAYSNVFFICIGLYQIRKSSSHNHFNTIFQGAHFFCCLSWLWESSHSNRQLYIKRL